LGQHCSSLRTIHRSPVVRVHQAQVPFVPEKGAKKEKIERTGKEVKSDVTDNESANMTTSHGVVQGINGQAVADGKFQVIVQGAAFGEGQGHYHVGPMVEGAKENLKRSSSPFQS
jgi:hypothetical protein